MEKEQIKKAQLWLEAEARKLYPSSWFSEMEQHSTMCIRTDLPLKDAVNAPRPRIAKNFLNTFGEEMFYFFIYTTFKAMNKKKKLDFELILPAGYQFE